MIMVSDAQRVSKKINCRRAILIILFVLTLMSAALAGYSAPPVANVDGTVTVVNGKKNDPANVAIWLEPAGAPPRIAKAAQTPTIHQKNKKFIPHVVFAIVGQEVNFPNDDPFPHNIFSNSDVKKFDLGLYQAGETRSLPITRAGVIPVYCNIHPQMQAYIIAVKTPYYALTNDSGAFSIANVPPGTYTLKIWHERTKPEILNALSKEIKVGASNTSLGAIQIDENGYKETPHKNKDGRDYAPGL